MKPLSFEIIKQDRETKARLGVIRTRRGDIQTPYLVPVATFGSVRALGSDDLLNLGMQCSLANTYHLHLEPGDELIARLGGLHSFMGFERPLFTDSGGFQAFSLGFAREHNISKIGNIFPEEAIGCGDGGVERKAEGEADGEGEAEGAERADGVVVAEGSEGCGPEGSRSVEAQGHCRGYRQKKPRVGTRHGRPGRENLTKISDLGISFKSQNDGAWHFLNAERSMKIQSNLGSDIIMAFDECTSPLSDYDYTKKAMLRTHTWAEESFRHHDRSQALYGIIQGGWFEDLRRESTQAIASGPYDGIAIGGSLGNSKQDMHQVLDWTIPGLDFDRPRHLLGIGEIDDLLECVERGIDTFDCVSPTRIARRGSLLIGPASGGSLENKFRINIKSARFRDDGGPIDPNCNCQVCRSHSRAYLRHLYVSRELSYFRLATIHNLHFMLAFMEEIRESIRTGRFSELKGKWLGR